MGPGVRRDDVCILSPAHYSIAPMQQSSDVYRITSSFTLAMPEFTMPSACAAE
jgi:hypothetical protein